MIRKATPNRRKLGGTVDVVPHSIQVPGGRFAVEPLFRTTTVKSLSKGKGSVLKVGPARRKADKKGFDLFMLKHGFKVNGDGWIGAKNGRALTGKQAEEASKIARKWQKKYP